MVEVIQVDTMQIRGGAVDVDERGAFMELRVSSVRLRRVSEQELALETEQGLAFRIAAPCRITVSAEKGVE